MLNRGSVDGQIGDDPVHQGLVNREPVYSTLDFVCVLRQIVRQAGVIIKSKKRKKDDLTSGKGHCDLPLSTILALAVE